MARARGANLARSLKYGVVVVDTQLRQLPPVPRQCLGVIPETSPPPVSTTDQTTDQAVEETVEPVGDLDYEPTLALEIALSEAEALRTWLLQSTRDGATALDDPLVSRTLTKLGVMIDTALAAVNVRHELQQAGLAVDHLTDEQVCELGRRVAQAAAPCIRQ